jgi:Concanavalin A-like lectin/glucanases superfamily
VAVNFAGNSSFRQTSATGMPGTVWTLAFWLKPNSVPTSGNYYNLAYLGFTGGDMWFELPGVDRIVQVAGLEGGPALTAGAWYRLAAVRNGASSALYVSSAATGALTAVASGSMSGMPSTPYDVLNIAASGGTGTPAEVLDGRMINFKLWSVALNAGQIETELGAYTVANSTGLLRHHRWDTTASATPDAGTAGAFTLPSGTPAFVSDTPAPLVAGSAPSYRIGGQARHRAATI